MIAVTPKTRRVAAGTCGIFASTSFIFSGKTKYGKPFDNQHKPQDAQKIIHAVTRLRRI